MYATTQITSLLASSPCIHYNIRCHGELAYSLLSMHPGQPLTLHPVHRQATKLYPVPNQAYRFTQSIQSCVPSSFQESFQLPQRSNGWASYQSAYPPTPGSWNLQKPQQTQHVASLRSSWRLSLIHKPRNHPCLLPARRSSPYFWISTSIRGT